MYSCGWGDGSVCTVVGGEMAQCVQLWVRRWLSVWSYDWGSG